MKWFDAWVTGIVGSRLEQKIKNLEDQIQELKQSNESLKNENLEVKKKIITLTEISKQITENVKDFLETEDIQEKTEETAETVTVDNFDIKMQEVKQRRDKDLEILNKNFKFVNGKVKDVDKKIDALIETVAEKIVNDDNETLPSLFTASTSLKSILQMKNNKAYIYALVYLLKKQFDEKGVRV